MVFIALIVLWLVATPAVADVIFVSGFDCWDEDSTSYDCFEFVQNIVDTATDDAEDADMVLQSTTVHTDTSGGDDSSKGAIKLDVASNESIFYTPATATVGMCDDGGDFGTCTDDSDCTTNHCRIASDSPFPLSGGDDVTVSIAWNFDTAPGASTSRDIFEMVEAGPQVGCGYSIDDDRYITVSYKDVDQSTFSVAQEKHSCAGYHNLSCDADADCPNNCDDGAPDSTVLHWAFIGMRQEVDTVLNNVICSLYINGIKRYTTGSLDGEGQTPALVETFNFGAINEESSTITAYIDDVVVCEDEDCGWGYVGMLYPTSEGMPDDWNQDNCLATAQNECLDEYNTPAGFDNQRIKRDGKSKSQRMDDFSSDVGTLGENLAVAVDAVTFGYSELGGTRKAAFKVVIDDVDYPGSGTITYSSDLTPSQVTRIAVDNPFDSADTITGIEWQVDSDATNNRLLRVGAVAVYVYVQKPSIPLVDVIDWGDWGADDSDDTILIVGDSTSIATGAATCPDGPNQGQVCSGQEFYCSWDGAERDKHGGCTPENAAPCNTCENDRDGNNGGAGWPCIIDTAEADTEWQWCERVCDDASGANEGLACSDDSDCTPGTCLVISCSAGFCNNITAKTCSVDSDCEGLGECVDDATCLESCPDSACPAGLSWPSNLIGQVSFDNLINCGVGAQTSYGADNCESSVNCFDDYLQSPDSSGDCTVLVGSFADPDLILVLLGTNDITGSWGAPNCEGVGGVGGAVGSTRLCAPASQTDCLSDADCSGVHANSVCIGRFDLASMATTVTCSSSAPEVTGASAGNCAVQIVRCGNNTDCGTWGIDDCTADDTGLTALYKQGSCKCDPAITPGDDDGCPTGYTCIQTCAGGANQDKSCTDDSDCPSSTCTPSHICHRDCTLDAECYGANGCNDDAGVCWGTCTTPSDDISCTDATDCEVTYWAFGANQTIAGSCGGDGKCDCTGTPTCEYESTCSDQYQQWIEDRKWHHLALDYFRDWQATAEGDTTGLAPRVAFMTVPDTPDHICQGQRGDKQYVLRMNQHLMNDSEWSYVIDVADTMASHPMDDVIADDVHPSSFGNQVIATRVSDWINSHNTCAINVGTPRQTVQRYCREADNTWKTTTCDEAADCGNTETCQVRSCTGDGDCPSTDPADSCNL